MGQNVERLGRLQVNRTSFGVAIMQNVQAGQRTSVDAAFESVAADVGRVVRTEGFGGPLGEAINTNLTELITDLDEVSIYHKELGKLVGLADQAMYETATGVKGLPDPALTPEQQQTLQTATETNSPVQVSPGVTMTPAQAKQYYADRAEAEQEEAARKMAVALDARLQELIDQMPTSKYDPEKPKADPSGDGGTGGNPTANGPGVNGGGVGTGSGDGGTNGTGVYDRPRVVRPDDTGDNNVGDPQPPRYVVDPPRYVVDPPYDPRYNPDGPPNIDGGNDGTVPGGPGGPGGPRLPYPGGTLPGGGGGGAVPGGVGGLVGGGTAGGVGGAALAGGLGRAGGIGAVGGINSMNAAAGASGAPGATGVVAQSGSGAGGRAGMMAGGGAAGRGGAGKRNRRRGQDLLAFEVDPEEDGTAPDLGAAGAAGSSESDGREDLGW